MTLHNRIALVTGCTQGIGQAIALKLAREGADIVINALRDDDRADATREQIRALGRRCVSAIGDVSQPAAMRSALNGPSTNWERSTSSSTTPASSAATPCSM